MSIGCCGTSAMPLSGRETSTAVSRHAAFSWVNQSVRCSNLQPGTQRLTNSAFTYAEGNAVLHKTRKMATSEGIPNCTKAMPTA